jgi:late competence protein required for DNA uptake (superfamily II DNA/RNA helicase)
MGEGFSIKGIKYIIPKQKHRMGTWMTEDELQSKLDAETERDQQLAAEEARRSEIRVCMGRHATLQATHPGMVYCETCQRVQWPQQLCRWSQVKEES